MDKIKQQLNKLTSEVKGLKKENKGLSTKIKKLEKRIPSPLKIDPRPAEKMYDEVVKEVIKNRRVSTSYIQRKFVIGYAKASCLMDMLEEKGVIGASNGANPRKVLVKSSKKLLALVQTNKKSKEQIKKDIIDKLENKGITVNKK